MLRGHLFFNCSFYFLNFLFADLFLNNAWVSQCMSSAGQFEFCLHLELRSWLGIILICPAWFKFRNCTVNVGEQHF